MFCFLSFFQFVSSTLAQIGKDFTDDFIRFDGSFWVKESNHMFCANHGSCAFLESGLTRLIYRPAILQVPALHELQISARQGCTEKFCCERGECTQYIAGQITSIHSYSYGSFKFSAMPTSHAAGFKAAHVHDAWTCFCAGTKEQFFFDDPVGISICVPSDDPYLVVMRVMNGNETREHEFRLRFNAAKHLSWFRFDWRPSSITFFVNKRRITSIKDLNIVDRLLHIKVLILPLSGTRVAEHHEERGAEFKMHLHRVKYRKYPMHVELLVKEEPTSFLMQLVVISSTLLIVILALTIAFKIWQQDKPPSDLSGGFYTLLNEDKEKHDIADVKTCYCCALNREKGKQFHKITD